MEKTFTRVGRLQLTDFQMGFVMAVLGAILGFFYESWASGIPNTWPLLFASLKAAGGFGIFAGITYLFKNLGTGVNGRLLTNAPPSPPVEKK